MQEEYSFLELFWFKKIQTKEEEELLKEKAQDWIELGDFKHIVQAWKVDRIENRFVVWVERLEGKTLRDWINEGFFKDKSSAENSKRVLNSLLQLATALHYLHAHSITHQQVIPENIFIQSSNTLKLGNILFINSSTNLLSKNIFIGGSPEYWSPEQGIMYANIRERIGDDKELGGYYSVMKLLPPVGPASDLYQLGLVGLEMAFGGRRWNRGDVVDLKENNESSMDTETTSFLEKQLHLLLSIKADERPSLPTFISSLLDFYSEHFEGCPLWCQYFSQEQQISYSENNKAVGLYLSGNEIECEKHWLRSIKYKENITAIYNLCHWRRMKRLIDDRAVNKNLYLLPESRKRNYYLFISNLAILSLLKEPFKTFNFNPKFCHTKEIPIITKIIENIEKFKKKEAVYLIKQRLSLEELSEIYVVKGFLIGRVSGSNKFLAWKLDGDLKEFGYITLQPSSPTPPSAPNSQPLTCSCISPSQNYISFSYNSSLWLHTLNLPSTTFVKEHEVEDYGSMITTLKFDERSEVLGIGSNEFIIRLLDIKSKQYYREINIGNKFIVKDLQFYDRNTCIAYYYTNCLFVTRIETTKCLFTIKTNQNILNYKIVEYSNHNSNHLIFFQCLDQFEIWNIKDKVLIRTFEIHTIKNILKFDVDMGKRMIIIFTDKGVTMWDYGSGVVWKSYWGRDMLKWGAIAEGGKYLYTLDNEGMLTTTHVDFTEFLKSFESVCLPTDLCLTDPNEYQNESTKSYLKLGKELVENLSNYLKNETDKKICLENMYRISETIKGLVFFQDKQETKKIFNFLNAIRSSEDRSSRVNCYSEEFVFGSRAEGHIACISNFSEGEWVIGDSKGVCRVISSMKQIVSKFKPKDSPPTYIFLQPTTMIICHQTSCSVYDRKLLSQTICHTGFHKKSIRFALMLMEILISGDEEELVLYWNKEKVKRYKVGSIIATCLSDVILLCSTDGRIRMYKVDFESGLEKIHVFVGHTMNVFKIETVNDSIFRSCSWDGSIRWWDIRSRSCISFLNMKRNFKKERILNIDMPLCILNEENKIDKEYCCLILLNCSEVVIFDTLRKEVKWRLEMIEQVYELFWIEYPYTFAIVLYDYVKIINVFTRYMVLK